MIARWTAGTCRQCGATFEARHDGCGRLPRFCSAECRSARKAEHSRLYAVEGRYPAQRHKPKAKVCVICASQFETIDVRTQCCGPVCGHILAKRKSDAVHAAFRARRQRTCENCMQEFVARNPSGAARRGESREGRFCSRKCAGEFRTRVAKDAGRVDTAGTAVSS